MENMFSLSYTIWAAAATLLGGLGLGMVMDHFSAVDHCMRPAAFLAAIGPAGVLLERTVHAAAESTPPFPVWGWILCLLGAAAVLVPLSRWLERHDAAHPFLSAIGFTLAAVAALGIRSAIFLGEEEAALLVLAFGAVAACILARKAFEVAAWEALLGVLMMACGYGASFIVFIGKAEFRFGGEL